MDSQGGNSYPPLPPGLVVHAIGDIHGRLDLLQRAHARIDEDLAQGDPSADRVEVYLGDIVDRGPESRGVIQQLIERSFRHPVCLIRGNHEIQMDAYLAGHLPFDRWRSMGGIETLLSYGIESQLLRRGGPALLNAAKAAVPASHRRALASARAYLCVGAYVFVHAGLRPEVPLEQQTLDDLAWIRGEFLDYEESFGRIVVHGHTPVREVEFHPHRINLDTGAYATNVLSVLRLDDSGVRLLPR